MESAASDRRLFYLLLAIAVLVPLALLVPLPRWGRAWNEFTNLCHAPTFALVALVVNTVLLRRFPNASVTGLSVGCWVVLTAAGLGSEVLQGLTGRSSSWSDGRSNAVGVLIGVLWSVGRRQPEWRARVRSVCVVLLFAAELPFLLMLTDCWFQRLEFPLMASFELPMERHRWLVGRATNITRSKEVATDGEWSLRVELGETRYPNIIYIDPVADWSAFHSLAFDVYLKTESRIWFSIKIEDREHEQRGMKPEDRFDRGFHLKPGWNFLRVPLAHVRAAPKGRDLNLAEIRRMQLYTSDHKAPAVVFIDNIRLE